MKKQFLAAAALLFFVPQIAQAAPVYEDVSMTTAGTGGTGLTSLGNWYADYDITSGISNKPIGNTEIFCTEQSNLSNSFAYDFYAVSTLAGADFSGGSAPANFINHLQQATWIANYALNNGTQAYKEAGQLAIWELMFAAIPNVGNTYYTQYSNIMAAFNAPNTNKYAYVNDWYFAVSPANSSIQIPQVGQNFLVKAPVPEPATMLLFGAGIAGLAAVARRKRS